MASPRLEFGTVQSGAVYSDRPAAFGICERDGRIALVRVAKPGKTPWFDLPGGAVDPGEDALQAVVREFGEETGLVVEPGNELDQAVQYFFSTDGAPYRNHGPLLLVTCKGEDSALKIEDDHTLVWMDPHDALEVLRHDSHAWAVACWLRRR